MPAERDASRASKRLFSAATLLGLLRLDGTCRASRRATWLATTLAALTLVLRGLALSLLPLLSLLRRVLATASPAVTAAPTPAAAVAAAALVLSLLALLALASRVLRISDVGRILPRALLGTRLRLGFRGSGRCRATL